MRNYDKVVLVLIIVLVLIQFLMPILIVDGMSISAFTTNLRYYNLHWSFNYFAFIMSIIILGLTTFLVAINKNYRKYYLYTCLFWVLGIVILFITEIQMEDYTKTTENMRIHPAAVITTLLIICFISLTQLIGESYLSKNKRARAEFNKFIPFKVPTKYNLLFFALFITLIVLGGSLFGAAGGAVGALIAYFIAHLYNKRKK